MELDGSALNRHRPPVNWNEGIIPIFHHVYMAVRVTVNEILGRYECQPDSVLRIARKVQGIPLLLTSY
jgi:hypothetical protein